MTKTKMVLNGNGLESANLEVQARELDRQIRTRLQEAERSLIEVGRLLTQMRESGLWKYLPVRYSGWEDYVNSVMGPRARSTLHETVAAYSLTRGSHPIPPDVVNKMGVKRAAQVARLEPEERTPEIREAATTAPVAVVRNKVQAKLNTKLPPDERRPMLKMFAINLPEATVSELEELLEVMCYMKDIRDGDNTQTMRQKAMSAMIWATQQFLAEELSEALEFQKAKEGLGDSPAAEVSEEEEGYDFQNDNQS
jgi:hypothetical protein